MFFPPDRPSMPRKILLAPLSLAYAGITWVHRRVGLRAAWPAPALPLLVVGSLRAGGAGKTSVVRALARHFAARGRRVGILVYRLRGAQDIEVRPDSDWRETSDEAVMLARDGQARVFATRDRAALWRRLDATGDFDLLVADDGLMDARLAGATRIVLVRPGERPGLLDLLPAGPFHRTTAALRQADLVLTGPSAPPEADFSFRRELVFPEGFDRARPWWMLTGIANPGAFRSDLTQAGVNIAGATRARNHERPDAVLPGSIGCVCTAKDAPKLRNATSIDEHVTFSPRFLKALEGFPGPASS